LREGSKFSDPTDNHYKKLPERAIADADAERVATQVEEARRRIRTKDTVAARAPAGGVELPASPAPLCVAGSARLARSTPPTGLQRAATPCPSSLSD